MKKGTIKLVKLTDLKPYWRNPRNNKDAVEKVKQSIQDFGYNQPIAVDKDNVIIAGHTRFKALQELGWTDDIEVVEVDLDTKQAKQYRIIDNKTNEFASWNDDLRLELRELEDLPYMQQFFIEDIQLVVDDVAGQNFQETQQGEINDAQGEADNKFKNLADEYKNSTKSAMCPSCGHEFDIK